MSTHPNYPKYTCTHHHLSPPTHNKCLPILTYPKYTSIYPHPPPLTHKICPPTPIHPKITATCGHPPMSNIHSHKIYTKLDTETFQNHGHTYSHPLRPTFVPSHSLLTTATNRHSLLSTLINSHPLSSTPTHSHAFLSTPIHSHPHSLIFNALALIFSYSHQLRAYVQPLSSISSPYPNNLTQCNPLLTIQTHI